MRFDDVILQKQKLIRSKAFTLFFIRRNLFEEYSNRVESNCLFRNLLKLSSFRRRLLDKKRYLTQDMTLMSMTIAFHSN